MRLHRLLPTLLLAAAATFAQAAGALLIDVDEANPPFMFAQAGKPAGIYPALVEAAFKHMNMACAVQTKPWKRAIQEIDEGTAGVAGIYKNPEREKKYDYSDKIFTEKLMIYFNHKAPVAFSGIADLKGKKVGVIRGWSYGDDFDDASKAKSLVAEESDSDESNFKKLDLGRLDAVVAISESGAELMARYKNVGIAATPLSQNPTYLTFAKSANQTAVLKAFDQAVKDMMKSGEYKKVVSSAMGK